jgi:hypothetical protein
VRGRKPHGFFRDLLYSKLGGADGVPLTLLATWAAAHQPRAFFLIYLVIFLLLDHSDGRRQLLPPLPLAPPSPAANSSILRLWNPKAPAAHPSFATGTIKP